MNCEIDFVHECLFDIRLDFIQGYCDWFLMVFD